MSTHTGRLLAIALTSAYLVACSNNGDATPPPPPVLGPTEAVPPAASESSAGLVTYLNDLAAASADDKEPVDLSTFAPKTPEDTEPEPVG